MSWWLKRRQDATCPRCALRFSLHQKRQKSDVLAGRWNLSWQDAGRLRVGYLGFRGWLGMWEDVIGAGVGIVPSFAVIGGCMMESRGVLCKNGLSGKDVRTGRSRRAGAIGRSGLAWMIGRERSYLIPHPFATPSILRPLLPYKKTRGLILQ